MKQILIGMVLAFAASHAAFGQGPAHESSGTRGGQPPAPFVMRAEGKYFQYSLRFHQFNAYYANLSIYDDVGGPSAQSASLRYYGPGSNNALIWVDAPAAQVASAKVAIEVSDKGTLKVLRFDEGHFSPLTEVSCECYKDFSASPWQIYLDYTFANGTTSRRVAGSYASQTECEKNYQADFPACDRAYADLGDFEQVQEQIRQVRSRKPAPKPKRVWRAFDPDFQVWLEPHQTGKHYYRNPPSWLPADVQVLVIQNRATDLRNIELTHLYVNKNARVSRDAGGKSTVSGSALQFDDELYVSFPSGAVLHLTVKHDGTEPVAVFDNGKMIRLRSLSVLHDDGQAGLESLRVRFFHEQNNEWTWMRFGAFLELDLE